jgi:hypothetical protein
MAEKIRWTLRVSKETDADVRAYLAEHGGKKGDLSKFVERARRRRKCCKRRYGTSQAQRAHPGG